MIILFGMCSFCLQNKQKVGSVFSFLLTMRKSSSPKSCKCGQRTSSGGLCKVDVSGSPCRFHSRSSASKKISPRGEKRGRQSSEKSETPSRQEIFQLESLPYPALYQVLLNVRRKELNRLCRSSKTLAHVCASTRFQKEYDALHTDPFADFTVKDIFVVDETSERKYVLTNKYAVLKIYDKPTAKIWERRIRIVYESKSGLHIELSLNPKLDDKAGYGVKIRNKDGIVRFDSRGDENVVVPSGTGEVVHVRDSESVRTELDKYEKEDWYLEKNAGPAERKKVVRSMFKFFSDALEEA